MSFFEAIDTGGETRPTAQDQPAAQPRKSKGKGPKPERLQFLKPCPLCGGRDFVHRLDGGFFCIKCQPGIKGDPVIAAGERTSAKKEDQQEDVVVPQHDNTNSERDELRACFDKGFPWIMEHLEELLQAGWTRPELFRRSKFPYPVGPWALAWSHLWIAPDLVVSIDQRTRAIHFEFSGVNGKKIVQTEYPSLFLAK